MNSHKSKHRLMLIFMVIFLSSFISCSKETKNEPQKIYDSQENTKSDGNQSSNSNSNSTSNKQSNNDLVSPPVINAKHQVNLTDKNTSSFLLDGQTLNPKKTEGYIKNDGGLRKINIASYTDSEGYFFELFVPASGKITGSYDWNENGNQLLLNHKENGLLTIYGSHFCKGNPGQVTIDAYDASENIISGSFSAVVCNKGMMGKKGNKTIHLCKFKDVKLLAL